MPTRWVGGGCVLGMVLFFLFFLLFFFFHRFNIRRKILAFSLPAQGRYLLSVQRGMR